MIIHPPTIDDDARRDEETLLGRRSRTPVPGILGALLDAVACALARIDDIELDRPPRMADFAKWVTAAEPGARNRGRDVPRRVLGPTARQGQALALEADEVTAAIYDLVKKQRRLVGPRRRTRRTAQARAATEGLAGLAASDGGGAQAVRSGAPGPRRRVDHRRAKPDRPPLDAHMPKVRDATDTTDTPSDTL